MGLLRFLVGNVAAQFFLQEFEKRAVFNRARRKADELGVDLLNYGCGTRFKYALDRSDINADVVPRDVPNFMLVEMNGHHYLPLPDKSVVVFSSHVLEHTDYPDALMEEFRRVSGHIYVITPSPLGVLTWLVPEHKWVFLGRRKVANPLYNVAQLYRKPYAALFPTDRPLLGS